MKLEKDLKAICKKFGLPGVHVEYEGDRILDDMASGEHPPSSVIYSTMMRVAHDLREFSESFELLCLDALEGRIDLLDFQLEAAREVFQRMNLRAILADEVGLGKTIEAGIVAKELRARGMLDNILVLAPKTLMLQWMDEFEEKFDIHLHHARKKERLLRKDDAQGFWIANLRSWYWSNSSIREPILERDWDLVIIDEAHHLKNHQNKAYAAVQKLRSQYLLLLTATPIHNSLQELYSLLHLIRPGALGDWVEFRKRFFADSRGQEVQNAGELRRIVSQNMIRRRRVECGVDYSDRIPEIHHIDFPSAAEDVYRRLFDVDVHPLTKVTWLKMGASSLHALRNSLAKNTSLRARKEHEDLWNAIRRADEEGEPKHEHLVKIAKDVPRVVVFTEYKHTMESIQRHLETELDKPVHLLHGGMRLDQRRDSIRSFKDGGGIFVSLPAGTEGLNLQFCNVVVNYDLPWNPMKVEQRIGRVHRIGQEDTVYVHTLSYKGTIEDFILSSLYRKLDLFKMSVGEVDQLFTSGTGEEEFELEAYLREEIGKRASLKNLRENLDRITDRLQKHRKKEKKQPDLTEAILGDA